MCPAAVARAGRRGPRLGEKGLRILSPAAFAPPASQPSRSENSFGLKSGGPPRGLRSGCPLVGHLKGTERRTNSEKQRYSDRTSLGGVTLLSVLCGGQRTGLSLHCRSGAVPPGTCLLVPALELPLTRSLHPGPAGRVGQHGRDSGVGLRLCLSASLIDASLLAGQVSPAALLFGPRPSLRGRALTPVALPLALPRLLAAEGESCSVPRDRSEPTTVAEGSHGVVLGGLPRHPPGGAPG